MRTPLYILCVTRLLDPKEGQVIMAEKRNARVVAYLVASMLAGAAVLLWLEPPAHGWSDPAGAVGASQLRVQSVEIRYLPAETPDSMDDFDCVVFADGRCAWRPRGSDIRVTLVAPKSNRLPDPQAAALLAVLGNMSIGHGLDPSRVRLYSGSDSSLNPELPQPAHDLRALLERKGFLR